MQTQPPTIATNLGANPNDGEDEDAGLSKIEQLERKIATEVEQAREELERFSRNDQSYRRKDTVEVVKDAMRRIKEATTEIN
jgi:hypothetical protein